MYNIQKKYVYVSYSGKSSGAYLIVRGGLRYILMRQKFFDFCNYPVDAIVKVFYREYVAVYCVEISYIVRECEYMAVMLIYREIENEGLDIENRCCVCGSTCFLLLSIDVAF